MPALVQPDPPPATARPRDAKKPAREPAKSPGALEPGPDRFIPVSRYDLRAKLVATLREEGDDDLAFARALDCLAAWRHQAYRKRVLALLEDYLPFSPDRDTTILIELDQPARDRALRAFIDNIESLLSQANYVRLSRDDVQRLLIERSPYGLHLNVDLTEFDEALLYYRGTGVVMREERNPWRLYLVKDRFDVPIFERLFLLLKPKPDETRIDEIMAATGSSRGRASRILRKARAHLPVGLSSDHIYVKVFRRIPQIDLEMLFPNTRIGFKPFDKLKLFITAGGGAAAGVMGTATKLLAAANPFTLAIGIFGLSAVIFRQVTNFFNTRNRYMMVLAQNLYFCSLANNHGALTLIADKAEEEDVKEDMLLYAFLARRPANYDALATVKDDIVRFLDTHCGARVDFDANDALRRLLSDGLIRTDAAGDLTAIAPEAARAHLDSLWDRLLDIEGPGKADPSPA